MKTNYVIPTLLVCAIAASVVPASADETVALSDTPVAVQKTVQAQVADGKMGDITKSAEDLDTVYDVELTAQNGFARDFTVAQDGTLLCTEVTLAETPAAVRQTIQSELNGSGPDSIDKNLDGGDISYDVEGPGANGKEIDFTVDEDGTLSSREVALAETPDAVQKAIAGQMNGGKVETIDENFDEDGTNFDVTVTTSGGSETSFNVDADGTMMSKEVGLDEVPARARGTIQNRIGDGTLLRVDRSFERRDNVLPFEVEGRKDGQPFDFSVAPRGRFLGMDD
ncbi:MAG TPA: hypothetical protein VMF08_21460 [Candidatus Sulfotelmatobacter sp.]|nr:hypothetical protein [Candidatus Sulfotelmatobacter sp.]